MKSIIKKSIYLVMLMVLIFIISSCSGNEKNKDKNTNSETVVSSITDEHNDSSDNNTIETENDNIEETTKSINELEEEEVDTSDNSDVNDKEEIIVPSLNGARNHKIIIMTDMHYLSDKLTDDGDGFEYMVEHGDGRMVQYCKEILEAWKAEVIEENPELIIISGDLTFNGERASHEDLANALEELRDYGIKVIVMPGNHDVNNILAASFDGYQTVPARRVTENEFPIIYKDFGYDDAISQDEDSLSYCYELNDNIRVLMIDSNVYTPSARVGGMIKDSTYDWIEEQLESAYDDGARVITVTHHNVLDESEVYVEDCTIEHSEELIDMLEGWEVNLHLSGHLHVQHYMKSSDNSNYFYEIVTGSLTTPPCLYGVLDYDNNGKYTYITKEVDMTSWAEDNDIDNEDFYNWNSYKNDFLEKVFINQAYDEFKDLGVEDELSEIDKKHMAQMYAELNIAYYAGEAYKVANDIQNSDEYNMWIDIGYSSEFVDYIDFIINDGICDYNILDSSKEQ